ncbi:kinase-like domain-containing protein, partial [Glomus cerebriforme]
MNFKNLKESNSGFINLVNEDWYQTAIKDYGINEIIGKFGKKDRIGYGASGLVYKTKCKSLNGIFVAIKEVNITSDDYKNMKTFINELKIHSRIDNGRIIRFYGISRNVKRGLYYLVLEYANQGNLREFIKSKNCNEGDFKWEERKCLATQIAEGLLYLHDELNIAHRDLHTKNILINDGNIKISDFGLSKNLDSTNTSSNKTTGIIPFIDPQKLINGEKFALVKESDIYSLGVVLWEISSCRTPFPEEDITYLTLKICQGLRENPIKGTPIEYKQIYTDCWELNPESRPSINEVLSRLQSVSLELIIEDFDENPTNYLLPTSDIISRDSTSGTFYKFDCKNHIIDL